MQRKLVSRFNLRTLIVGGSIIVWLGSSLTGIDSARVVIRLYYSYLKQASQTWNELCMDISFNNLSFLWYNL